MARFVISLAGVVQTHDKHLGRNISVPNPALALIENEITELCFAHSESEITELCLVHSESEITAI